MILRPGQSIGLAGRFDRHIAGHVHGRRGPQREYVHAHRLYLGHIASHVPRRPATVTQGQFDRSGGLSRQHVNRHLHLSIADFHVDQRFVLDAEFLCCFRTDQGRAAPGQLRHRVGQFLEPTVVGEAAVVDRPVATKNRFEHSSLFLDQPSVGTRRVRDRAGCEL